MALPTMRAGVIGREFLRIAGGFGSAALGSSPAGGLDIDNAGNLATDGDVTASSVAIGTSTPAEKLQVLSSADESVAAEVKNTSTGASAVGVLKASGNGGSIEVMHHGTGRTATRYGITVADYAEILANGSAGLLIGSQEAVDIVFGTNSAERMRIDSSGDVGIGIVSPDGQLHVHAGSAGSVIAHGNARNFIVENNGICGMSILSPDASQSSLYFGSPSDSVGAQVNWNHDNDLMILGTHKASAALSIRSGNNVEAINVSGSQVVKIPNLAGTGTRAVVADANGVLSAP